MFGKKAKSQQLAVFSIILLVALFAPSIISVPPSIAASSSQKIVLAELFTSTWCGFCPYATQAINKLADEYGPSQLLILQYHPSGSDPFGNDEIDARIAYYGIPGYPTMIFDGNIVDVGGSSSTYDSYDSIIENELTKSSEVAISLKGNLQDITAEITGLNLMPQLSAKVQFVLYEKDIPFDAPNGEDTFTFTVREILNEEHISLNAGQKTTIRRTFQPDPEWNIKKMGLIVFVQNDDTDEILQAATFPSFSIISEETTKNIQTNEIANYTALLMNSGDFDDTYEITSVKSLPIGWEAGFCLGTMCHWDSALVSLEANSLQVVEIFIVAGNVTGTASINFTIKSELDPAHTSSIVFIANAESPPNNSSVTGFNYSPLDPEVDDVITFDASSGSHIEGTVAYYAWDFGDGTTSTEKTPTHQYEEAGTYSIQLMVTDNNGATDSFSELIVIKEPRDSSNPLQFILEQPWILIVVVFCVIAIISIAFVLRKRRK